MMTRTIPNVGHSIRDQLPIVLVVLCVLGTGYWVWAFARKEIAPEYIDCAHDKKAVAACECSERVDECMKKGQYEEALKHANILVEMDEWHTIFGAFYTRARIHVRLNDFDAAIRDLTISESETEYFSVYSSGPNDRDFFARGRCYDEKGMKEAAAADYRTVYNSLVDEIARRNEFNPQYPYNYMGIILSFWTLRQHTDRDFGFDLLQFQEYDSAVETKRARLNAVLNWLREHVDVHPEIIANIDDLDAEVYELAEEAERRTP